MATGLQNFGLIHDDEFKRQNLFIWEKRFTTQHLNNLISYLTIRAIKLINLIRRSKKKVVGK